MASALSSKRVSLEEVNAMHKRMLNLEELDKKLDVEMRKLTPETSNWEKLWQSQYNDLIDKLEKNDVDLLNELDAEEEFTSDEDLDELLEDESILVKKPQSLRVAMEKQLSLLDTEKKLRNSRIDYFEKLLDVETKRNEILSQKAALSAQIRDLLEAELNSEKVLDSAQEPMRRTMISDMARWWDCLLYNMSVELNQCMEVEEVGKWSELYLKWCLWTDLKAGVFHDEIDDQDRASTN